jgi:GT2 family glycosyltransferase
MDLSIILVHYRSPEALLECLRTLAPERARLASEVVVVDNAPDAAFLEALAAGHPDVRVIANSENVGYARAVNQGIRATSGEAVLVMNPDCEVRPGAAQALLSHLRAHPRAAIAGPRILNPDGTLEFSARSFPGPLTFLFNRYSLLTRLFPGNPWSRAYLLTDWDHQSVREVDWLSGACLLVRRAAIEAVGGMDEAFFMFNEDVDWCRRMKLAGWANVYVPEAVVVHHVGASRKKVAPRVIWERHRGMAYYFHKHHPTNPLFEALAGGVIYLRAGLMLLQNALRPRA